AFSGLVASILPANPFQLAIPCLELAAEIAQAFAHTVDEDEIQFQQYRALKRLEAMRPHYVPIPEGEEISQESSKAEQEAKVEEAKQELEQAELAPTKPSE